MRVATNAYTEAMINQFNNLASTQSNLQNQVSTGLSVSAPSDNPAAMQNTLNYIADNSTQQQYVSNITTLQARATSINGVLQSMQSISSRAGEIAVSGASTTATASDLSDLASEVNTLIQQVVSAANTKDPATGQYLFGGTASNVAPFTAATDANGNITGVTYNGNTTTNQTQIGLNVTASVDIPGVNTGVGGSRGLITDSQSGADFFNHLIALRNDLNAGNKTALSTTDNANLQNDENNIAYQAANNGVVQNKLTAASTLATGNSQNLNQLITTASSANMVTTMVQLNQAQTAYQAALSSGSKIMQLSILNYIH